ncbi:MAG: 4Fe-4S binding protein [Deltaproteobacteria bacterium]|uniref:4Fe-4S binding protein n=1 Tax=Candidatus Zymogenus saltonus TaxID=2844893 RepID=A0A9D8PM63_9DELT|nr:4Fe-4S binding protein [Candidatus Zymogenus saltonus]
MDNISVYEKLRDKLSVTPVGAPKGEDFLEILSIIFTPDEADLALSIPFMPATLEDIAKGSSMDIEQAKERLNGMADKGIVYAFEYKGTPMFMLFGVVPGIFEFPIMKGSLDIDYHRLKSLWKKYHDEGWDYEDAKTTFPIPMGRILAVEEEITSKKDVLPTELVYKYIDEAKYICVGECACRTVVNNCDSPKDVCMGLGYGAKFLAERGMARLIEKEEAKAILKRAHEAGLISCVDNNNENVSMLCNCCPCCCGQLTVATKHGRYDLRPVGAFVASVDSDKCTACGACEDRCPMKAISINDSAEIDPDKCIGCGLCVSECPVEALAMVRREPSPTVYNNIQDWAMAAVETKGTAKEFMEELGVKEKN